MSNNRSSSDVLCGDTEPAECDRIILLPLTNTNTPGTPQGHPKNTLGTPKSI